MNTPTHLWTSPAGQAWDRMFAQAERDPDIAGLDWHQREPMYRIHDRLFALTHDLDPARLDDDALIDRLMASGTTDQDILRLLAAWRTLVGSHRYRATRFA